MKKIIAILTCVALLAACAVVLAACGKQEPEDEKTTASDAAQGEITGGWTKADSPVITDAFKKVFTKAMKNLDGVDYIPVAYLASQVVAGTNHCVLCKATPVVPDGKTTYAMVTVYEDLSGNAEITEIVASDANAAYPENDGGWTEAADPALTDDAKQALAKACETLTGAEYTPVALLATRVAAGTDYRIVCESKAAVPNGERGYVIVDIAADLEGNAEILETYEFEKGENTQMKNPIVEYGMDADSLKTAQEAVGFKMTVPQSVKAENYIVISGKTLEIDFDGGYIRKAKGSGDISGDYNDYTDVEVKNVNGKEVTLKGNNGKIMLAIWVDGDYTYCIGMPAGVSEADMISYVNTIQ